MEISPYGGKKEQTGKESYLTLCRRNGADYLARFDQASCIWKGCIKRGGLRCSNWPPQSWRPSHLQSHLSQQEGRPPTDTITPQETIALSLPTTVSEVSITPSQSERAVSSDQQRLVTLDEYREENEEWRTAFAADIQRILTENLHPVGKKTARPKVPTRKNDGFRI